MKAAVIGSRALGCFDIDKYISEVERQLGDKITIIITGGARGVDTVAAAYADRRGIPKQIILPDYTLGKGAPLIRNKQIVKDADIVIAFWDGQSRGTLHAIKHASVYNKPIIVYKSI